MTMRGTGFLFINGQWVEGKGASFTSLNPSTEDCIWEGHEPSLHQIDEVFDRSRCALNLWKNLPVETRVDVVLNFKTLLESEKEALSTLISIETGKPKWESVQEVGAMCSKVSISIDAFTIRCNEQSFKEGNTTIYTRYKPHGILIVVGPFNFPGHLPNGHIIPALIAGNTVIFKPSELTPAVGEYMMSIWERSGLPPGVIQLIQGGGHIGRLLAEDERHNGVLFTGSSGVGASLSRLFSRLPHRLLALEMGGNNPLVVYDALLESASAIVQSAFMSAGQRCTCTRRLILLDTDENRALLSAIVDVASRISIYPWDHHHDSFYGPLISKPAMDRVWDAYKERVALGGRILLAMTQVHTKGYFLTPGIIDVTGLSIKDEEYFGPLLSVYWVQSCDEAIAVANDTQYGLSASVYTQDEDKYHHFFNTIDAGIINWNMPTNGASSKVPFGGIKGSGNHRPSAFFAADYCSYPVASVMNSYASVINRVPGMPDVS